MKMKAWILLFGIWASPRLWIFDRNEVDCSLLQFDQGPFIPILTPFVKRYRPMYMLHTHAHISRE
jgi:hypothetical protein